MTPRYPSGSTAPALILAFFLFIACSVSAQPALKTTDRISPLLSNTGSAVVVIEGDRDAVRRAIAAAGGVLVEHPDLLPNHTLAQLDERQRRQVASSAGYIFPAAPALVEGRRVTGCPGAMGTEAARLGQSLATYGEGWDGPGRGSAVLKYAFGNTYAYGGLSSSEVRAEVMRALEKWSSVAAVDFVPGSSLSETRTIAVSWVTGEHGDGTPLSAGVLAHAFYPTNGEPWAGDIHFNQSYSWYRNGMDYDVYRVALHESGHALGLAHNDADSIMYPYYYDNQKFGQPDIDSIQSLYAARIPAAGPPSPSPTPGGRDGRNGGTAFLFTVSPPPSSTSSSAVSLTGSISGGVTPYQPLAWRTDRGYSGNVPATESWWTVIPLDLGANVITVSGRDAAGAALSKAVIVTRVFDSGDRKSR